MVQQTGTENRVSEYTILQDKIQSLQEKNTTLHKENIKLLQENEVLRHCWDKARIDIDRLQRECQLLQRHLNPANNPGGHRQDVLSRAQPKELSDRPKRNITNATV